MTFLEAAIAILQREGRPLHFKKLTEIALKDNLLTVVGRTPELTMQQRLNEALKKDDPHLVLTREKPGVFGLRHYPKRGEAGAEAAPVALPAPVAAVDARSAGGAADGGAVAGKPEGGEEGRRRRRRGGRGRRRRDDTTAAPGASAAAGEMEGDDVGDVRDEGEREPADAGAGGARGGEEAPAASAEPRVTPRRPAVHDLDSDGDGEGDGGPVRATPPLPGTPERRSFAEAAAVVAAAHRRRATGESPPAPGFEPAPPADLAASALPEDAPTPIAAAAPPTDSPAADEPDTGVEEPGLDDQEFEHPSGPLIAPAFGTEEMVRGEEHREPIEKPGRFARGRERERHRDRRGRKEGGGGGGRGDKAGEARPEQRSEARPEQRGEGKSEQRGEGKSEHRGEARGEGRNEARGGGREGRSEARGEGRSEARGEGRSEARGEGRHARRPDEGRREPVAGGGPAITEAPASAPPPPASAAVPPRAPQESRTGVEPGTLDAVLEILRGTDGRPIHVRQIVEMAMKRRLLRGDLNDLIRLVRGAITIDAREREAAGLRPRVRPAGGSSYQLADRRLEAELVQQERELGDRALKLGEATRQALLRRLGKLPPHAFEALMRLLAARLGIGDLELVKRGDGVAYFGGERSAGSGAVGDGRRRRVLIGVRSGDADLSRRAVGELRAGLQARSYDEGLLFAPGRIGDEALSELGETGGAVTVHDAEELAALCVRHGVGAMRRTVPVDVLDVELLGDLAEA